MSTVEPPTNDRLGPPTRSFGAQPVEVAQSQFLPTAAHADSPPPVEQPTPTPIAFTLPGYTFIRFLEKGGMGQVGLYHEPRHNRDVAIKICTIGDNPDLVTRFLREYETLKNLDHPNVVRVYDHAQAAGVLYFSMRFIPTGSLTKQWAAVRTGTRAVVEFVAKVARAVQYVHDRNVLHRDLKPGNILVDERGQPILADFGLAWANDGRTATTYVGPFGTFAYMAPEVMRAGPAESSTCSDVWAIGVILYELLAGVPPFPGEKNDPEFHRRVQYDAPPPLAASPAVLPDIDDALECIVLRTLSKSRGSRYETAAALADDLDAWLSGCLPSPSTLPDARAAAADTAPIPPSPTRPQPRRRWLAPVVAAAAAALLGLGAFLGASLWARDNKPSTEIDRPPELPKRSLSERLKEPKSYVDFILTNGKLLEAAGEVSGVDGSTKQMDEFFEVSSTRVYLYELGDEVLPFPVRLVGDVRLSAETIDTKVGLYASRKGHPQATGGSVHVAFVNSFGAMTTAQKEPRFTGKHGWNASLAVVHGAPKLVNWIDDAWQPIEKDQPVRVEDIGDFHTLDVRIEPDRWRAARGGDRYPKDRTRLLAGAYLPSTFDNFNATLTEPPFGGGFGLFVLQGSGQFKSVRLERADD